MKKSFRLTYAVLASSVFVAPIAIADTSITGANSPVVGASPPYLTSAAGNIEVTPTGQIASGTTGVNFDNASKALIVDANNTNGGIAITATGDAVDILAAGTSATITNNVGSTIQSTGAAAVNVAGDLASITNNGTFNGSINGLLISATGTNATVNNIGGSILGGDAVRIIAGSSGTVLNNSMNGTTAGTITGTNSGIRLEGSFTTITNNTNSKISAPTAINIASDVTGEIINSGTISGTSNGISIGGKLTGSVTNLTGGIIEATSAGSAINILGNSYNSINNAGTIQATNALGSGIRIFGASPGTIINSGTISSVGTGGNSTTSAITFATGSSTTSIVNTGTIFSTNATAIDVQGAATVSNGITNSGNITGSGTAINLGSFAGVNVPLVQNGGTITGNVFLASAGGTVLTMTGGTIAGNVNSTASNPSTLTLSGGTITGTTTLGDAANNTVNLSGTSLQALNGGTGVDTFNITGGSFTSLDGGGNTDIMNANGTFTSTGTITNVQTINVNNAGTTYTATGAISALNTALNINANTTMVANAGVGGVAGTGALTIANGGTLQINSGSSVDLASASNLGNLKIAGNAALNLTGAYSQTGAFTPIIQDMTATGFGKVVSTGSNATFNAGSTIAPQLGSGSFILNNFAFPVVQGNAAVAGFGNLSIVQPTSAILSYTLDNTINVNQVNLISHTNSLASVALPDVPLAVANGLDPLVPTTPAQVAALNPELLTLFGQLQLLPDIQSVSSALQQLAPGINNALPMSSRISMDNAFDSAHARLEAMTRLGLLTQDEQYNQRRDYELYNGVNYGDRNVITLIGQYGLWVKGTATLLDQHKRNFVEGYKAESTALALGYDWQPNDFATVGIAQSFTKVDTKDYTDQQNSVKIKSTQTTVYSTFVPYHECQENTTQTIYLDTMLAIASHKYDTTRNIVIGNISSQAKASFYGWHYGGQADLGYAFISEDNYLVAPVARFRYTYLDIGNYSETQAGGLGLTVQNDDVDEVVGGLGIRLALKRDFIQAIYVPEFSVFLLYDFAGKAQEMQANFLGGGNPFYVNSQKPAQYIQQYGAGITAYTSDGYSFNLKGNFEHREQFFGYSVYAKMEYTWG
ncbi:MAG: autotransporter domain-containing protein [Candidatus Berkiella sp.]